MESPLRIARVHNAAPRPSHCHRERTERRCFEVFARGSNSLSIVADTRVKAAYLQYPLLGARQHRAMQTLQSTLDCGSSGLWEPWVKTIIRITGLHSLSSISTMGPAPIRASLPAIQATSLIPSPQIPAREDNSVNAVDRFSKAWPQIWSRNLALNITRPAARADI
jgi:hypothetical protein